MGAALAEHFPDSNHFPSEWQPPSEEVLMTAVRKCHGAAGCDSWNAQEICFVPVAAITIFHHLSTRRWIQACRVPRKFMFGRTGSVPNAGQTINVADLMPMTILSMWSRIWAAAWTQRFGFLTFAKQLPLDMCGLRENIVAEEAAVARFSRDQKCHCCHPGL